MVSAEYSYGHGVAHPHVKVELSHRQPLELEKAYYSAVAPLTSRVFFLLGEKELTCLKVFRELDI